MDLRGITAAVGAAVLFGLSAPASRSLLGASSSALSPWLLGGLLYLGSGLGLGVVELVRRFRRVEVAPVPREGRLAFAGAVVLGGVLAPVLLLVGLRDTPASSASLLLNLEGVLTAVVAWVVVREHTDRRMIVGFLFIVAGGAVVTFVPSPQSGSLTSGAWFVAGACLCWAIDNNLTRAVSSADPVRLALVKGLAAGSTNTLLAVCVPAFFSASALPAPLPSVDVIGAALVVGFLGYGASLVLFIVGLRHLGAARNGAYFSAAPFVGVLASWLLLDEPVRLPVVAGGALMAVGLAIHLVEHHAHEHIHEDMTHSHEHEHDEHHQHAHAPGIDPRGPHTHEHHHARLVHTHAHTPDLHHRHEHGT